MAGQRPSGGGEISTCFFYLLDSHGLLFIYSDFNTSYLANTCQDQSQEENTVRAIATDILPPPIPITLHSGPDLYPNWPTHLSVPPSPHPLRWWMRCMLNLPFWSCFSLFSPWTCATKTGLDGETTISHLRAYEKVTINILYLPPICPQVPTPYRIQHLPPWHGCIGREKDSQLMVMNHYLTLQNWSGNSKGNTINAVIQNQHSWFWKNRTWNILFWDITRWNLLDFLIKLLETQGCCVTILSYGIDLQILLVTSMACF